MTEQEARDLGRLDGEAKANQLTVNPFVMPATFEIDEISLRRDAGTWASHALANRKLRSNDAFFSEFVSAFNQTIRSRIYDLPEVKVAARRRWIDRSIAGMATGAQTVLDRFAKNFAENPLYAFEWADGAIAAAAQKDIAANMKMIVESDHPEHGGYEAAVRYARKQAIAGARYPSRSTSPLTNLIKEEKTAAWAEFANKFTE